MISFSDWTPDDSPAVIVDVREPDAWAALQLRYDGASNNPALSRVLEVAEEHECVNVLIERRYIDQDWRSEHAHFYSSTFARYPSVCHRLHFFKSVVPPDLSDLSSLAKDYIGYTILRPLPSSPVGRTMLRPPPNMRDAVVCTATDVVDVLGWPMAVSGMPFMSQDAQFLRCAHADMWMVSFLSHLRSASQRHLPAMIQQASMGGVVSARQVPSEGLTVFQMLNALTILGFSPGAMALPTTAAESEASDWRSLYAILCRYVNSNIPPIVVGNGHVWVVVGYAREPSPGNPHLTLYRHDDALGPYIAVDDPFQEPIQEHRNWRQVLLPLPTKIYLSGERAELSGRWWFNLRIAGSTADDPLREAAEAGALSFVTYGLRSRDYKQDLVNRPLVDPELARTYRLSHWPRSIWVIEAQDRRLRERGEPCVLGEVILDPTSNHLEPKTDDQHGILAVHAPGIYIAHGPDHGEQSRLQPEPGPYQTGRRAGT